MEKIDYKKIGIGFLIFMILWHLFVAITDKIHVSGLFIAKPEAGYTWRDTQNAESKFFWQSKSVKWKVGTPHPDFKVETGEDENNWNPMPGYVFIDKNEGLATEWKEGTLHPDFRAWADKKEGDWIPVTGYRFVYENNEFVDAVWEPNKKFLDLKISSLTEQDQFKPFPGYLFIDPAKSLKVVWTPGVVNSENPNLVAGATEGTWEANTIAIRRRYSNNSGEWFTREVARRAIWSL